MAGRPVVATRVGGIPETIRDGVDGLLVQREDPAALAEAVCRLLADPALAERLAANGREGVVERFGHDQDMAAWKSVLETVLTARST
jgi:glycosyltransferase involved in cell wall biosynthesis